MNQKCIRSLRIARELMRRGFRPIDAEPARKSPGFIVFIFRDSDELNAALDEIMSEPISGIVNNSRD
ncbi:hypothetical protein ACA30_15790 [Virgibacillus soli]|nr:hypothetical protein ACA30_15790 [Virgibacillus soli]